MMLATGLLSACGSGQTEKKGSVTRGSDQTIGRAVIKAENGLMTPEILHSFGQVSDIQYSPQRQEILYGVTYTDIQLNKKNRELFVMKMDGSDNKKITNTPKGENAACWVKDGSKIAFLYNEDGKSQIWEMNPDGSDRKQISNTEKDIQGFIYSPDNTKVLFISDIKYGERSNDKYPDLEKASGRIVDDLMYKHWDEWVESIPHVFVAELTNEGLRNIVDLLEGEPFEAPLKPFGGTEQLAWSVDSKSIAYTSRKKTGKEYAQSTNSDIYLYNLESKQTRNLTQGMMGYDINPSFSPDGQKIAWLSMERGGYESDKNRLFVMDLATGEKEYLTETFDNNTDDFAWNSDSKTIYMLACVEAKTQLFAIDTHTKAMTTLTEGCHDYASVCFANTQILSLRHSMSYPNEIFSIDLSSKEAKQLTSENAHILDQLEMGRVEERWITTTDNKQMLTWVVYPPKFDPTKKYPTLLYCQGGPQSTVSQFWSYRWNLQMMAANGYIVVAPNRRGLPSFGQEWLEQISKDYGGQNMKDYLSAIDALSKESFVDETRLGCTGASYGGFSVYWLAGNHNKRFKAFLSHAGIFNTEAQYLETEEMWFADWDLGGPFWDKSNAVAQRSFDNSPHKFVQNWDTPIMITHGELDYRILASQGMMAFNAAQLRGIPSRMLVYPNENHWIAQPQNGVLFQREFFRWFDQHLKL